MNVIGIDACRIGWCVIGCIEDVLVWNCFNTISEVILKFPNVNRILIDIPIGLSSANFDRNVDAKARKLLIKRKSSIFTPPCREAVFKDTYQEALIMNRKVTGKGISVQAYNISPKIREIDLWLDSKPNGIEVYEAHPELCFKSLNKGQDLDYSKHDNAGIEDRKAILFSSHHNELEKAFETLLQTYKRSKVKPDDILDAMAIFVVGSAKGQLLSVNDENETDESGKPVRIVYGNTGLN